MDNGQSTGPAIAERKTRQCWRFLKQILLIYCLAMAIVVFHFPRLAFEGLKSRSPEIFVLPVLSIGITASYFELLKAGSVSSLLNDQSVSVGDLLASQEPNRLSGTREIAFDLTPMIPPGKEGREALILSQLGGYEYTFAGAFLTVQSGHWVGAGSFLCLRPIDKGLWAALMAPPSCFQLSQSNSGRYFFRALRGGHIMEAAFLR